MGEHVHEWRQWVGVGYRCNHCPKQMNEMQAIRRLNATEKLSAKRAMDIAEGDRPDELWAYATALEEDDAG